MRKRDWTQTEVLRSARLRKGYTQVEAAEKAGIPVRMYQRLEIGERDIRSASMKTGLAICAALRIDPMTLILGEE